MFHYLSISEMAKISEFSENIIVFKVFLLEHNWLKEKKKKNFFLSFFFDDNHLFVSFILFLLLCFNINLKKKKFATKGKNAQI